MKKFLNPKPLAISLLVFMSVLLFFRHLQDLNFNSVIPLDASPLPGDFKVYMRAVERLKSGINPYVVTDESPYKYSPGALIPFLILPSSPALAWVAFKFFSVFSWFVALSLGAPLRTWKHLGLLLIGISLSWKGLIETLDYGQLEFWVLSIGVLAHSLFRTQRGFSGFLLGCLPCIKPQWGLLIFPFLFIGIQDDRARLKHFLIGYALGGSLLGVLLPGLVYGLTQLPELFQSWLYVLKAQPEALFLGDHNQSLLGTLSRWKSEWPTGTLIGSGLTLCWLIWVIKASVQLNSTLYRRNAIVFITPWLILTQLMSPLGWRWGSLLLIGAPFLWKHPSKTRSSFIFWALALGIFASFLIQQAPIARMIGFENWADPHHYGSITLFWMITLTLSVWEKQETRSVLHKI
jgi:hypothetical protein